MNEYATEWTEKDMNNGFTYQWNPDSEDGPTLKITKSSLGTFNFCNGSYKYSYDPFAEGKKSQKTSEAMMRGTIVHNAQEEFWKMVETEKAMPFIDDSNKLRTSAGVALDIFTPIGPLSFSLSQAMTKKSTDKTETFRFNLGTTF